MNRELQLAEAFVGLSDTLAPDVDPVVLLDRLARHCVDIVGADAVGVMVATLRGNLRPLVVTDDQAAYLEILQLQSDEGPCLDCYRQGRQIDAPDLDDAADRWPRWVPPARRQGVRAVHALPLRVNHQTVGAVNLLLTSPGGLNAEDLRLCQALSDVAALALIHWHPSPARPTDIRTQVQAAASAKATIEIATGLLAEHGGLSMPQALAALRAYTRRDGERRLSDVAHALVQRALNPDTVLAADA
jgi:hypothetical protein